MRTKKYNKGRVIKTQGKDTWDKIVFCGNFEPPHSTENDYRKSFESLGIRVIPIQENKLHEETSPSQIAELAQGALFVLYTRTWTDMGKIWQKTLAELRRINVPTVSVHLDLYFGLARGKDLEKDPFFQSDFVFSADGGHQKEFKAHGINHFFLPPAILKDSCYRGKFIPEQNHKVIFVGSYNYHKEWDYRPKLINWLTETYGKDFRLYGARESVRGDALNNLYESAEVVVGDSTWSENYWSDRIPETLGRGGFLIHPGVSGLENQFIPYKHFIPYMPGDFESLKEIIDYYAEHKIERDAIRHAAAEHVKKNHTYENRVNEMMATLKKEGAI
jgi:hypothetical protein